MQADSASQGSSSNEMKLEADRRIKALIKAQSEPRAAKTKKKTKGKRRRKGVAAKEEGKPEGRREVGARQRGRGRATSSRASAQPAAQGPIVASSSLPGASYTRGFVSASALRSASTGFVGKPRGFVAASRAVETFGDGPAKVRSGVDMGGGGVAWEGIGCLAHGE